MLKAREGDLKFGGDFRFRRTTAQTGLAVQNRLLKAARLTAKCARTPVHLPEAIEDRPADAEFA